MTGNKGGRPPSYTSVEELEKIVEDYFETETRPTLSGLAYHMGIDRKTLYNYSKSKEFFPTIKRARDKMIYLYEQMMIHDKDKNVTGIIFALKNWGWSDKTDITSGGETIRPILGGISDDSNNSNEQTSEVSEED